MVKLLSKQGFQVVRQKGDHVSLFKSIMSLCLLSCP
ncbi:MAG: type II toxin-antitoxin system HicA family toxin [Crenarchaeota archaeon]|nr:type II toxin-antitoxin system HicA family toxin [Thermoproteota archaeon]